MQKLCLNLYQGAYWSQRLYKFFMNCFEQLSSCFFVHILYLIFFIKVLVIRIFFIRIFFNRIFSITIIRRNLYIVSNKLGHLFYFGNIFTFFWKRLRITIFTCLRTKSIKITDKQINWGTFFWDFVIVKICVDFSIMIFFFYLLDIFHYIQVHNQLFFWYYF